ncbi:MAG: NAD-dependent epimerase/dehydratase family protein [Ferruginibacter sp.]|nr:NAD-dependent epimerase/dehydratase family protein [Cytophagales bacterium]
MEIRADKILVIGANGQLGSELTGALRQAYGTDNVVASDVHPPKENGEAGLFEQLDVLNPSRLGAILDQHRITQVYLLAAMLSATGEQHPKRAWDLNVNGLLHVLDAAVEKKLAKVYWPSSIAVFGPRTPDHATPQHTVTDPGTVYGISKLAGERWCEYYFRKHGVDVRSLRYPGLIGYQARPGGGTTDYAVDIYHKAAEGVPFECFLTADTCLPMLYMPDALRATLELMGADADRVKVRSGYNLAGNSLAPRDFAQSIRKFVPDFRITYRPDFRQQIADSWPKSIDDAAARQDWGWQPAFSLDQMTEGMLTNLKRQKEKVEI